MIQASPPPVLVIDYRMPSERLPWLLVTILIVGGVVVPAMAIGLVSWLVSAIGVNWPATSVGDLMMVLAHPLFAWPFYGLALAAGWMVIRLVRDPYEAAMIRRVRWLMWVGLAINLQYLLLVAVTAGTEPAGWAIGLIMGDLTGAAIYLGFVVSAARAIASADTQRPLQIVARRVVLGLIAWFGCVALVIVGLTISEGHLNGLIAVPMVFVGLPHLQVVAFSAALLLVRAVAPVVRQRRDLPAWLLTYAGGWTASTGMLVWSWYFHPMHSRPLSYIATAATRGHPGWVRSRRLTLPDGRSVVVNRQLHRLVTLELLLAVRYPALHRPLRRLYDRVGPVLAAGVVNAWMADVAYLALKPLEWTATAVCSIALRGPAR